MDTEPVRNKTMFSLNYVVIAIMRKFSFQPVARFAGSSNTYAVGNDDEILHPIQRLALAE